MKFEIADWRFEVTWDGLLCQPIERGRAKAEKKSAARSNSRGGSRKGACESRRHAIGRDAKFWVSTTFDEQTHRKGATK